MCVCMVTHDLFGSFLFSFSQRVAFLGSQPVTTEEGVRVSWTSTDVSRY